MEKTRVNPPAHRAPLQLSPKKCKEQEKKRNTARSMFWHFYHKPYSKVGGFGG